MLNSFTGTCVFDLKRAIKLEEELPVAASLLKLCVGKPDGKKEDLDELQKVFREGKSFDLSRLVKEYEIDVDNPISVEFINFLRHRVVSNSHFVLTKQISSLYDINEAISSSSSEVYLIIFAYPLTFFNSTKTKDRVRHSVRETYKESFCSERCFKGLGARRRQSCFS